MVWNWQQDGWPTFVWDERNLALAEARFAEGAGVVIGTSKHLNAAERVSLSVELMSHEAVSTSAIEGEILDRESVQSSLRKHLGLVSGQRRTTPAEAGIAQMMSDIYSRVSEPLTGAMLNDWHRLVTNGRTDLMDLGRYRKGGDPMQIISGPLHRPKVHFEAPPAAQVEQEMTALLLWLNRTHASGATPLPTITRAGIAHLWFESIHPYEDGNGRLGRAISEKCLAQGLSSPIITGMASILLKYRKAYYAALERAHHELDITDWLVWFAAKALKAQQRTLRQVEFILDKSQLLQRLGGQLNPRQEKVLLRLFAAGSDGFIGGLSAANYMTITGAPPATATRDLTRLVAMDALVRSGENKATRYWLNVASAATPA